VEVNKGRGEGITSSNESKEINKEGQAETEEQEILGLCGL